MKAVNIYMRSDLKIFGTPKSYEKLDKKTVFLITALSCSGKTTFVKKMSSSYVIDLDDLILLAKRRVNKIRKGRVNKGDKCKCDSSPIYISALCTILFERVASFDGKVPIFILGITPQSENFLGTLKERAFEVINLVTISWLLPRATWLDRVAMRKEDSWYYKSKFKRVIYDYDWFKKDSWKHDFRINLDSSRMLIALVDQVIQDKSLNLENKK